MKGGWLVQSKGAPSVECIQMGASGFEWSSEIAASRNLLFIGSSVPKRPVFWIESRYYGSAQFVFK